LEPLIVTLHLLLGMTTLGLLWWLMLSLPRSSWGATALKSAGRKISGGGASPIASARQLVLVALAALAVPMALGGWTSRHYAALFVLRRRGLSGARLRAWALLGALGLQLLIGISMVLKAFPLWLATAHTAGAALLLLATLALLRCLSTR